VVAGAVAALDASPAPVPDSPFAELRAAASLLAESPVPESPFPESPAGFAVLDLPELAAAARSFFAQPEPLKCTADVVMPLRIEPSAPHAGQNLGPASWIPWITSVTSPQRAQA
jgi:hypothetical protein